MSGIAPVSGKQLHQQNISISKAVNPNETPVKEKHVRSAIIGTYQEKSGSVFWMFILRQPIQENRIVAWKFCHVLHKILREGHPRVIIDSQRHKNKLEDLGKMWQHLKEGYGRLIHLYIRLLITKLEFHNRNPGLPGNLQVTTEELERIGENDINIYFQMSVEMFDYMDDILNLQKAIFGSLNTSKSNSMTPCGQCRLAPLIPCIQDASQLYDYCVKILFKLHNALPADTLIGHRDRFFKQFQELKIFYTTIKHMQYFKQLITIPGMPEKPPNFLIQSELRTYVTPVVVLPQEEPIDDNESTVDSLIDTSDTNNTINNNNGQSNDRDNMYQHEIMIAQENERQRDELLMLNESLVRENQRLVDELKHHINKFDQQLILKDQEISRQKQLNDDLGQQNADLILKLRDYEDKNQQIDEKFKKLKEVYAKLREEHINLIRKKAEIEKLFGITKLNHEQLERRNQELEQRYNELIQGQATAEQEAQRVSEARLELENVRKDFDKVKNENLSLIGKIDFINQLKSVAEGDLHDILAQKEELDLRINEIQKELERTRIQNKADYDSTYYELIITCITSSELIIQNTKNIIENPAMSALTCTPDYLESLISPSLKSLEDLLHDYKSYINDTKQGKQLIRSVISVAYNLSIYLINAKSTSNISTDISLGDKLGEECKNLAIEILKMLINIKEKSNDTIDQISIVKTQLNAISSMSNSLSKARGNVDELGDLVENELQIMDKAIEEAVKRIQQMIDKSKADDSGLKLEVNGKILDSCTELMKCIKKLVKKSRILQIEIVEKGKFTASPTEFYKRNHQWSEGLISAAKAIAMGANFLLEAADKVVSGNGKFEQLMVASQGIAASTAQLVVASRVKADRNSNNLSQLSEASREVTQAVGSVVAIAKSCSQLIEDNDDLDVSSLTLHQAKRLEMEAQVHVLELEQALETERLKLAALRRHHYQMAGEE